MLKPSLLKVGHFLHLLKKPMLKSIIYISSPHNRCGIVEKITLVLPKVCCQYYTTLILVVKIDVIRALSTLVMTATDVESVSLFIMSSIGCLAIFP